MHFFRAGSLVLALGTLGSHATPSGLSARGDDEAYVPLETYQTFESPPAEETLQHLATELTGLRPAEVYYLSVFHSYAALAADERAALTEQRALNSTIDDEVKLCMWTWWGGGDCWPLWVDGHRRELQLGWAAARKAGERDYDRRMEYVGRGEAVAGRWARALLDSQRRWRIARYNSTLPPLDSCMGARWLNGTSLCD